MEIKIDNQSNEQMTEAVYREVGKAVQTALAKVNDGKQDFHVVATQGAAPGYISLKIVIPLGALILDWVNSQLPPQKTNNPLA